MNRPEDAITLTVFGEPASKANSRRKVINRKTGAETFIKSSKALKYATDLARQVPVRSQLLEGPLCASIWIYYASQRPDLDESLILDGLQKRIYKNDRQVREKHVYHGIDRDNPRAEIQIEAL